MHVHILGICGTFMGGIAALARASGHRVTGSDQNVYPPMSDQLKALGIELIEGYDPQQLRLKPDIVVVGNVMSRGNPLIEALLESDIPYTSGPEWLARHVLAKRWTLAVAGTHGKTTTSSILAWLLEYAGLDPGFLIGGVPGNFNVTARLGGGAHFVVEADEYDTAFFDKRAKFVHYRPRTAVINNLEHDHADIYPDVASIQWQFHQLMRMVPRHAHQLMKLPLDRRHIGIDIRVIVLEVVDDSRAGTVVNELGALIEECGVVFVSLDHEMRAATQARCDIEVARHAADQESGIESRIFEQPSQNAGRGRLA